MSDQTQIQQTSTTSDPNLSDLLNLLKKEIFLDLNCQHLGTVQSFNPETQTITATINYTKTIFTLNSDTQLYVPTQVSYPQLLDVPVIVLGGGDANLTFPIAQGDQCLIFFNDRSIDNWFASGLVGPVASSRLHSLADGIALVGLRYLGKTIQDYDASRVVLRNGTAGVGVGTSQIKIFNETNGSLGANFTALFTALQTFVTSCESSMTDPVLAAAAAAFSAALMIPVAPSSEGPIENIEGILE